MNQQPKRKQAPKTGPLTPLEIGRFSYRDGVWYVLPAAAAPKRP
jgi:hypothetical protein